MRRRRSVFAVLSLVAVVLVIETTGWLLGQQLGSRAVLYVAPASDGYASYLARRDPQLGWPPIDSIPGSGRDASGSRIVPAFPDRAATGECVALYGESFTWSSGVGSEDAWGNRLSRLLGCRVANYGVGGYGTDQALLRFRGHRADSSRVAILGFQPENILRNVNQWRYLLYADSPFSFKPRFLVGGDGRLELIPLPTVTAADYDRFAEAPERMLAHDYFAPGGLSGTVHLRFPFLLAVIPSVGHVHVRAALQSRPWYAEFYDPGHPSGALTVAGALLAAFHTEATARGQVPLVVILPNLQDLEMQAGTGRWSYQALLDRLAAAGVRVLDLGPGLLHALADSDPAVLFGATGHYSVRGCRVVAALVFGSLLEARLMAEASDPGVLAGSQQEPHYDDRADDQHQADEELPLIE